VPEPISPNPTAGADQVDPAAPAITPPARSTFDYAVIRVVPRVELEEFLNAGVIVFCLERRFLAAHVRCEAARLHALWPSLDIDEVARQLDAFRRVAAGDPAAGPIARLTLRERFHWLVSPRNTILQISPVHTGITDNPAKVTADLLERLVPRSSL
jgi:hypothetical protein